MKLLTSLRVHFPALGVLFTIAVIGCLVFQVRIYERTILDLYRRYSLANAPLRTFGQVCKAHGSSKKTSGIYETYLRRYVNKGASVLIINIKDDNEHIFMDYLNVK